VTQAAPTLGKLTPRPGARALEFIHWAIDTHGQPGPSPGRVTVGRSQAALVAAHPAIDSQGTVSWYLRQLRDAGIVVGARPITVDLDALGPITGQQDPHSGVTDETSTGDGDGESPGVAHLPGSRLVAVLLARRAEQQARLAQLQAELALTDAAIARAFVDFDRNAGPVADTRDLANNDSRDSRLPADLVNDRDAKLANQEGRKVYLVNPPSFLNPPVANRDRETRDHSRAGEFATRGPAPSFELVDEIVEPLRAWCRTNGRIDHLDDTGRCTLAALGEAQLSAGVTTILLEAAADPTIRRPVGLLIDRARKGHADTFRPPTSPPSPRPPIEPTFETRDSPLGTDVLQLAASPAGLAAARDTLGTATASARNHATRTTTDDVDGSVVAAVGKGGRVRSPFPGARTVRPAGRPTWPPLRRS
jgi:hypothetical protein